MSNTRQQILSLGEALIRTRGYHAFSYKDISQQLNIKNAAIHYHFPAKADLGVGVIQQNIDLFKDLESSWDQRSYQDQLKDFINIYEKSHDKGWSCLMGALSSSTHSLPKSMQDKLGEMAEYILERLTLTLEAGLTDGAFSFAEAPKAKAQLMISALLSSLLLDKVMKENVFETIVQSIIQSVESHK